MNKRRLIISLALASTLGAAASIAVADPDAPRTHPDPNPAKHDSKRDSKQDPKQGPKDTSGPQDLSDSFEVTVRAGKGRLGVAVLQIGSELRTHFGAPADRGVLVDSVRPESPAARAGVRVGDVIVEVDGAAIASASDVLDALGDRKQGEAIAIAAIRGGQRQELRATLADDPAPAPTWQRGPRSRPGALGQLDPDLRRWFEDMPSLDPDARRSLDEARKRIEELERRLERIERR
jgi:membrane-associated protease RseP (regulator of RpoE activity)